MGDCLDGLSPQMNSLSSLSSFAQRDFCSFHESSISPKVIKESFLNSNGAQYFQISSSSSSLDSVSFTSKRANSGIVVKGIISLFVFFAFVRDEISFISLKGAFPKKYFVFTTSGELDNGSSVAKEGSTTILRHKAKRLTCPFGSGYSYSLICILKNAKLCPCCNI